jgi:prepilin-type N-terminal cleavage/methylation domain-containing protein
MIKNNKGVTLVELLIVIVVMGIIAAFAIPAVGTIIENTNRDAVLNDAYQVENAARLYCVSTTCTADQALLFTDLDPYIDGDLSVVYEAVVIAVKTTDGFVVRLDATAATDWEFTNDDTAVAETGTPVTTNWLVPSESVRDDVTATTP